jgi:uncharacterized membrane protein YfcA
MLLPLKLLLVPFFLLLVSLAGRYFGAAIAGWLAGLPVVVGPILLVLALENGRTFAAAAATASTAAVLASVSSSLAYAHAARRFAWPLCLLTGLCAWLTAALLLSALPEQLGVSLTVALATLLLAPRLFPPAAAPQARPLSPAELGLRMVAGAALTLAVSAAAATLGGRWSGLLAVFPVLGMVLAVFSHRSQGAAFATALLRAMATGLYSLMTFCALVGLLLPSQSIGVAFLWAVGLCLGVQGVSRRAALRARPQGQVKTAQPPS